jgi:hypothetical protein
VCDQLSDKGICSAGAFAHPAFLKEHHFENLKSEFPSKRSLSNKCPLTQIIPQKTLFSYPALHTMSHSQRTADAELST